MAGSRFVVSLIKVVWSPYRSLRGQSPSRSSGQSTERFRAPGAPGGPGRPAPGPVEEGYKSRADPACLFTPHPSTPPEELVFTLSSQGLSFQPCGQLFLCTVTWAGHPTAAVGERWGRRSRPGRVDAGEASCSAAHMDWFLTTEQTEVLKSLFLPQELFQGLSCVCM